MITRTHSSNKPKKASFSEGERLANTMFKIQEEERRLRWLRTRIELIAGHSET